MLAAFVLLVIAMMKLFPQAPAARLLHEALVEAPLRGLAAMSRRHLIYGALLVTMLFAGAEMVVMLGSSDLVMLMAWDVLLYVDAVIAAWTIAAVARGKAIRQVLIGRLATPRPRAPRRRTKGRKTAANDADGDGVDWRYARAA